MKMEQPGRLTLPTDADVVAETLRLKNLLGADALRDCDGTEMPKELLTDPAKKYATYYTTRKDNAWAEANPDEVQQEYLISDRHTARGTKLRIHLMDGFHTQQLKVNTLDDPKRWWEVIDRTPGEVVKPGDQIEVFVLKFDPEKKKISLGYKTPEMNPWNQFLAKYSVGDVVTVKIVKLVAFGAFAEIMHGVAGLIHISQISDHRVEKASDALQEGQEVEAKIIDVDTDRKRSSLSIRALRVPQNDED